MINDPLQAVKDLLDSVNSMVQNLMTWIYSKVDGIGQAISSIWTYVYSMYATLNTQITNIYNQAVNYTWSEINKVNSSIWGLKNDLTLAINTAYGNAKYYADMSINLLRTEIGLKLNDIKGRVDTIEQGMITSIKALSDDVVTIKENINKPSWFIDLLGKSLEAVW